MAGTKASRLFGGDLPIGSLIPIKTPNNKYENRDGSVWLKTGTVDTDTALYPDAATANVALITIPAPSKPGYQAIASTGGNLWIMADLTDRVLQHSYDLVPTSTEFPCIDANTGKLILEWDEANDYFVIGRFASPTFCYRQSITGANLGNFSFAGARITALAIINADYWVIDSAGNGIKKFDKEGVNSGFTFTPSEGTPTKLSTNGTTLYVLMSSGEVYEYQTDGTLVKYILTVPTASESSMHYANNTFYFASTTEIFKYGLAVGHPIAQWDAVKVEATVSNDTEKGLPLYVRID